MNGHSLARPYLSILEPHFAQVHPCAVASSIGSGAPQRGQVPDRIRCACLRTKYSEIISNGTHISKSTVENSIGVSSR
jgi:hypothetical protein